ncbi:lipopolysaccharide assembly protein [Gillisia sp. Hel_I_86]|uniref:LptE family protein n=1 Tax=Gillisia sp. Hel_I_86 TaxID=1249981 RepID=UPI00119B31F9|nr:LptE family protein [Gillisia sp. Hel_I_86]TVZ27037.1 lipopolysaccharide assembly protein [Gillisia sp. Hel_I_86]
MFYKKLLFLISCVLLISLASCGLYSFTGADTGAAKTFQVNYFQNTADRVIPGIDRTFTLQLQDLIQGQTNLSLTNEGGDLIYEGEIIDFYEAPITATAQNTAAQNRLTITVNLRYYNTLEPEKDIERRFSFYYDYPANALLTGPTLDTALDEVYTRITQDIFNATLTNW